ncbi:MAG: prepilin-type N-terminal cleavage/methylation domain-containing protein [Bacteriovoracaceae bacterium]|nr:prepilin-type N-terminal cleavage/methylation domain-containing protein [Bacteriovoracaceae bacterium]
MKTKKSKQGMSLIEAMVAGTILAIILVLIIGAFQQLKKRQRFETIKQASMWQVYHLVEGIKSNIGAVSGDKTYTMSEALEQFKKGDGVLDLHSWSHKKDRCEKEKTVNGKKIEDLSCKGEISHGIYPLKDFPGVTLVIGISHPEIFLQADDTKEKLVIYKQYILGSE